MCTIQACIDSWHLCTCTHLMYSNLQACYQFVLCLNQCSFTFVCICKVSYDEAQHTNLLLLSSYCMLSNYPVPASSFHWACCEWDRNWHIPCPQWRPQVTYDKYCLWTFVLYFKTWCVEVQQPLHFVPLNTARFANFSVQMYRRCDLVRQCAWHSIISPAFNNHSTLIHSASDVTTVVSVTHGPGISKAQAWEDYGIQVKENATLKNTSRTSISKRWLAS